MEATFLAHLKYLVNWLHLHPHWGGMVTFVISMAESIAILGLLVPGSIFMTGIGTLIGLGILPILPTLAWAISGAIVGDGISYWLGYRYKDHIHDLWPFRKWPALLSKGEVFFTKHGGKSVLLGRFVGPVRPIVPLIAGMLSMAPARFFAANVASGIAWAPVYLTPGILIGAAAMELPPEQATQFVLLIFGAIIGLWLLIWLIRHCLIQLGCLINNWLGRVWHFLLKQPSCQLFCKVLRGSRPIEEHIVFNYFILFLASASLFIWVAYNTVNDGILTTINLAVFHLMRSLYTPTGEKIATIITMFGEPQALFPLVVTVSLWFMIIRNWRAAWHWLITSILTISSAIFFRDWLHLPRPNGLLIPITTPSFPSGHATLNVLFYGMLALLVARALPAKYRSTSYWLASFIATSIMISRLYLGAHWLSDLLGGILLALSFVFLAASSYYRHITKFFSAKHLLMIFFGTLIITWSCYFVTDYHKELQKYAPYWPLQTLNIQEWWMQESAPNALYRTSHFGKPLQAINIQWADSLADIRKKLLSANWQEVPTLNLQTAIKHFAKNEDKQLLPPIVPRLYRDRAPVLIMIKLTPTGYPLVLRLWNSYTLFADSSLPLWYGIVEYQIPAHHKKHASKPLLLPANSGLQAFEPYLTHLKWKIVHNSNPGENDEFLLVRLE